MSPTEKHNQLLSTARCGFDGTSEGKKSELVASKHYKSKNGTGQKTIGNTVNYSSMK
jgi:hypothetical protein